MTRALVDRISRETLFGARLHAGAVRALFPIDVSELNDRVVAVEDLGLRIHEIGEIADPRAFERILTPKAAPTPLQQALRHLAAHGGHVRLESLCQATGLSPRQFRRRSLEECGIGPKQLARIARFRHACRAIAANEHLNWAALALDCGYYDQPHLNREFAEFSGMTPREFAAYWRA